jgi:DNA-binding beta-propeller fold protein YncE
MNVGKGSFVSGAVVALVLMAVAGPVEAGAQVNAPLAGASSSSVQRGFIDISGSPGIPAANPKTDTLYVPIQCINGCPALPITHTMDVVNTATCNATDTSDCRVIAKAKVGGDPLAAAVDERTDTIYTANAVGTVSVVDGATCNAAVTSGCGTPLATIHTGGFDVAEVFNPVTRTLYVSNPAGSVFVIGVSRCNAETTQGCGAPVKEVKDDAGPAAVNVDLATDSVYAVNNGTGDGNTVTMIDGATCNGSDGSGCGHPRTITVGSGAFWPAVDQDTDTIYVTNGGDDTISVINGARCNSEDTSGCASVPPTVPLGASPAFAAVDDSLHTVFTVNQQDNTLSAINTRTCRGTNTSGCATTPPTAQGGPNHGPGYTGIPNTITLLPDSDTAYLTNVGGESRLSVITLAPCNAVNTAGCRNPAPSAPAADFLVSVDGATNTIYAGNLNFPEIDVINGATCNVEHQTGCEPVAEIPMKAPQANLGFGDATGHTLYASDESGSLAVIDTADCSAQHTGGCARAVKARIPIGAYPGAPVLNAATETLYLPYGANANRIAVVDVADCNAEMTSGCAQTPAVVKVGEYVLFVAVSTKADTVYAPIAGGGSHTVDVINGATCNGADHSGCGHIAATATVGPGAFGVAVDDATDSVYVSNNDDGGYGPGTLSVIDSATCNGTDTAGCAGTSPSIDIGRAPATVVVDTLTDTVYVADSGSDGVAVVDGATCNAEVTSGCARPAPEQAVGVRPFGLGVNQATNTVYAMDLGSPPSMSMFLGRP